MKKRSIFLQPGFMRQLNLMADVVFFDRRTEVFIMTKNILCPFCILCSFCYSVKTLNSAFCINLTTSPLRGTPPKNYFVIFKRRVTALIGSIVPTKILAESQKESFPYLRCKDTMQKSEKVAIMKKTMATGCR